MGLTSLKNIEVQVSPKFATVYRFSEVVQALHYDRPVLMDCCIVEYQATP